MRHKKAKTCASLALLSAIAVAPLGCGDDSAEDEGAGGAGAGTGLNVNGGPLGEGGASGGGSGDGACGVEEVEGDRVAANLLLVVDSSGSMKDKPDGFSASKWSTLVDSLKTALPEVDADVSMGLKLFPSGASGQCGVDSGVEVAVGSEAAGAVNAAISKISPDGATPTARALQDALAFFQSSAGMALDGQNYVLLATDGGPNCNDSPAIDCTCNESPSDNPSCGKRDRCTLNIDAESGEACSLDSTFGSCCLSDQAELCLDDAGTLDAVEALKAQGVTTIVLGMPGSEAYTSVLDQLAAAGGLPASDSSPKYYEVQNPAELTSTLRGITRGLVRSCDIQLETAPPDRGLVNVYIDGKVVPKNDEDGWRYEDSTSPVSIVLTGPTCKKVEDEGAQGISIRFGCPTEIIR